MKQTIVRLVLILVCLLLFYLLRGGISHETILISFIVAWVLEPWLTAKT